MKKLMMILVAMMVTVTIAFAQTASCKINGGTQNTTVVASITSVGDGYVMVVLDNDGDFAVNVTIKITGSGNGSTAAKVSPSQSREVRVPVALAKASHDTSDFSVSISGARCN